MEIQAIKPGPNQRNETDDKKKKANPETQPKHPSLKPHKHKPND